MATVVLAQPVAEGGRKLTAVMNGAQEVNPTTGALGAGDPNGSGVANVVVNVGQQRVCWNITVQNIDDPKRAHIHSGVVGTNGGIVVSFFEAATVDLDGCTTSPVPRTTLRAIVGHPERFYVNIHNDEFPGGAIRGQLR